MPGIPLAARQARPRRRANAAGGCVDRSASCSGPWADDFANGVRGGRKFADKLALFKSQNMGRLHEVWSNAILLQTWNAYRAGV